MPALVIDPSEAALPSAIIPPRVGSSPAAWAAYKATARAAGMRRSPKAAISPVVLRRLTEAPWRVDGAFINPCCDLPKGLVPGRPPIARIVAACAYEFGISPPNVLLRCRTAEMVLPRQVAMYLAREMTTRSLPEIGRLMGGRDHTTIWHGHGKIARMIAADPVFSARVESIRAAVMGGGEA